MKTFKFRTDAGDQDDIQAASLKDAADIAAEKISDAAWEDGAWGWVEDENGQMMRVPNPLA